MSTRSSWKLVRCLPLIATLAIAACGSGGEGKSPQAFQATALFQPVPASDAVIPFPFDGLFSGFTQPTLNIPVPDATNDPGGAALVSSVNHIDGFSTTADIFCDVGGDALDYSTVGNHIVFINTATGKPLVYGTDFTISNEDATSLDNGVTDASGNPQQVPISAQRSRILIKPLKPLSPSTTYLLGLVKGIRTLSGAGIVRSPQFDLAAGSTPVTVDNPIFANTDPTAAAEGAATLEALRTQLIGPAVQGISQAAQIPASDVVLAWTFTTESIGLTLGDLAANVQPQAAAAANTTITTDVALSEPGNPAAEGADIYAGILQVPYYLAAASGTHDQTPLTTFWQADATKPNLDPSDPTHKPAFLGEVPCAAFATHATLPTGVTVEPSTSTTLCFPVPVQQSLQTIPLVASVPNAASGQTAPGAGWPVAIFVHGITRNRLDSFALAPALARAGFVTVAIDLPLHGETDPTSPFYRNQLFATAAPSLMTNERTFDLDLESNSTGAPGPDGTIDPSGAWFINLSSLLTSRDNLRQAEADLMTLRASLSTLSASIPGGLDTSRIVLVGHSLGGIVSVPFLANDSNVGAATLAMAGGGISKLLDASHTIGPQISTGLAAAAGLAQGSDDYETFLRFGQTIVDDGDPINYAAAAAAAHPIHFIEITGGGTDSAGNLVPADLVVPNAAPSTCPGTLPAGIASPEALAAACPATASEDIVIDSGELSGSNPLIRMMGLTVEGPIDVPTSPQPLTGGHYAVQFREGDHGSILDPTASLCATIEMQTETATFLASNGALLPLGATCP
jgi:pimeloyl-ACP methyl ester carboxylesterase